MDVWKRQRLQECRELCPLPVLMSLSNILSNTEIIYVKYLFKMDFSTMYRFILPALTLSMTVTKSVVIEMLFILKRWEEINQFFRLNIRKVNDCFVVAQFTNIPVKRKIIVLLYMLTSRQEKQLFLNMIYAFLEKSHLRLGDDEEQNAIRFFSYVDELHLTRDVLLEIIYKLKNTEINQTMELLLSYNELAR
ncbi:U15 [Human betaherpesvirus 6B]|uniref:U15 n=1 Tax=Human herpesvirus 6B TaxID=32604 RepID=A0A219XYU0_HHV6H|nr:protein U15 [Human betaherpesvirus 6B]APO37026.1 protein U15 [Human betaherpesvirus 6B]APO37110.1 protein U15 [Human betaherpesvirus 6B]APO37197.1 protein U15 [Human betaherpesvirus 6B]APO37283.1 protein U15 [Human betaherpesvirus 6B]